MTNVDQFESAFKSAAKATYTHETIELKRCFVLCDLKDEQAQSYFEQVKLSAKYLACANTPIDWHLLDGNTFDTVGEMIGLIDENSPDLIFTYRNLHSTAWRWPYSLGAYVDVLTQVVKCPVMLLPHPSESDTPKQLPPNAVMAMTDHLTGDDQLVNWALAATPVDRQLLLTHVENQISFDAMIETISRVPAIDTDIARDEILQQKLKEPRDYITACKTGIAKAEADENLSIVDIVTTGRLLEEYKRLIKEHNVELLVMNTKDEDQLAMHGLAYPLAVELRDIPMLLL